MKAIVYDKRNAPEVLVMKEIEKPVPSDDEVLVKIFAFSVNAADYRSIKLGIIPKSKIFGSDIAGRIESVGKNVQNFSEGDEVIADTSSAGFGGFAEYVTVSEALLVLKPREISFQEAAAIPMAAITALAALRNKGDIRKGKKVLIYGAGGGVGTYAIQLSKYFGAEVTAVCSEGNAQLMKDIGADFVIDYERDDFSGTDKLYDLVVAVNGKNSLGFYKKLLNPDGVFVVVGGALSQIFKTMIFGMFLSFGGKKFKVLAAKPDTDDLKFLVGLVQEGKINPVIDKRFSFEETMKAVQYISKGHARGKVVVSVCDE